MKCVVSCQLFHFVQLSTLTSQHQEGKPVRFNLCMIAMSLHRSLKFIEEYITREVLPSYGNTHTTTSFTSRQSTHFREEARYSHVQCINQAH